jgi:hypothetical protein
MWNIREREEVMEGMVGIVRRRQPMATIVIPIPWVVVAYLGNGLPA